MLTNYHTCSIVVVVVVVTHACKVEGRRVTFRVFIRWKVRERFYSLFLFPRKPLALRNAARTAKLFRRQPRDRV